MRKDFIGVAVLALASVVIASPASATSLRFLPTPRDMAKWEVRTTQLLIEAIPAQGMGAFDVFVQFDPTVLSFRPDRSVFGEPPLGDQLACPGLPATCTDFGSVGGFELVAPDTLRLFEVSFAPSEDLDRYQIPVFVLAQLAFQSMTIGESTLEVVLTDSVFVDSFGEVFTIDRALPGQVRVLVSEPPTLLLLGFALVIMMGPVAVMSWARRRQGAIPPRRR